MLPDREYEEEKREWHRQGCKVYLCTCFFLKTSQSTLDYQKLSLKKHKKSKKPISALHRITCLEEEPFKIWLHLLRKEGMKVIQPLLCFDRLYTIFNHQKKHAMQIQLLLLTDKETKARVIKKRDQDCTVNTCTIRMWTMVFSTSKPSVSGIQQGRHFSQAVPFLLMDFQPQIPKFVLFCYSFAWKFWFYFIGQQIF